MLHQAGPAPVLKHASDACAGGLPGVIALPVLGSGLALPHLRWPQPPRACAPSGWQVNALAPMRLIRALAPKMCDKGEVRAGTGCQRQRCLDFPNGPTGSRLTSGPLLRGGGQHTGWVNSTCLPYFLPLPPPPLHHQGWIINIG